MCQIKYDTFFDIPGKTIMQKLESLHAIASKANSLQIANMPYLSFYDEAQKEQVLKTIIVQQKIEKMKVAYNKQKQQEGYQRAKIANVELGRKRKTIPKNFNEVCKEYKNGNISQRKAAKLLKVSNHTFVKWYEKATNNQIL